MNERLEKYRQGARHLLPISIGMVWLFHISAIIGMSIGYGEWFVTKTPMNLTIMGILLYINFPLDNTQNAWLVIMCFLVGMVAEWIGVHTGIPFGTYEYGENLGLKVWGVPLLIGLNWAILTLTTSMIATYFSQSIIIRSITGAGLMVFLDYFMETSAPPFDFWTFEGGHAPLVNYAGWFGIAFILHFICQKVALKGHRVFSLNLYLAQLVFFSWFHVYPAI